MFSIHAPKSTHATTYIIWRVSSAAVLDELNNIKRVCGGMTYFSSREAAEIYSDNHFFVDAILHTVYRENNNGSLIPRQLVDDGCPRLATDEEIKLAEKRLNKLRDLSSPYIVYDVTHLLNNKEIK